MGRLVLIRSLVLALLPRMSLSSCRLLRTIRRFAFRVYLASFCAGRRLRLIQYLLSILFLILCLSCTGGEVRGRGHWPLSMTGLVVFWFFECARLSAFSGFCSESSMVVTYALLFRRFRPCSAS